jgi:hypothetical protein
MRRPARTFPLAVGWFNGRMSRTKRQRLYTLPEAEDGLTHP